MSGMHEGFRRGGVRLYQRIQNESRMPGGMCRSPTSGASARHCSSRRRPGAATDSFTFAPQNDGTFTFATSTRVSCSRSSLIWSSTHDALGGHREIGVKLAPA